MRCVKIVIMLMAPVLLLGGLLGQDQPAWENPVKQQLREGIAWK